MAQSPLNEQIELGLRVTLRCVELIVVYHVLPFLRCEAACCVALQFVSAKFSISCMLFCFLGNEELLLICAVGGRRSLAFLLECVSF